MVDVFANNTYPESIVHSLIEKVAVELNNVWMMLRLKQLYCFFLENITTVLLPYIH